jgi:NAD(P)-dependent dehydrogenase (short-subunit alcohol dehydrogenase family)
MASSSSGDLEAGPASMAPRVLVATLGEVTLGPLVTALARGHAQVACLAQARAEPVVPGARPPEATPFHFAWDASTRGATERSVEAVVTRFGDPTQLVVHALPAASLAGRTVADHEPRDWHEACGTALLQTIHLLQALAHGLKRQRASIVFVGASLALVGAQQLGGLVTLLETQRGLMKSVARQWGASGVTCNWIALEACELWPGFGRFDRPRRLEAIPVALGRRPDAGVDLAETLAYLGSPAGRALTGATLCLDGGEWMVP